MFQEPLARLTADHLRSHIKAYLDAVSNAYSGSDKVTLVVPKSIEVASRVGGLVADIDKTTPQYAVDCLGKSYAGIIENLHCYQYTGALTGIVTALSQQAADKLVKRHARAVDQFIKEHLYLHQHTNDDFTVLSFTFQESFFSGAEYLGEETDRELWVAAFTLNVLWMTSESTFDQHDV